MKAYVSELEKKLGPSALLQKIYDIEAAICFLVAKKQDTPEEDEFNATAFSPLQMLKDFRCTLRYSKRERESLKDLPSLQPT